MDEELNPIARLQVQMVANRLGDGGLSLHRECGFHIGITFL
jgi:hypothetical protein